MNKPYLRCPCLCVVTNLELCQSEEDLINRVSISVECGAGMVQIREKQISSNRLMDLAKTVRQITLGYSLLFINGRVDIALACEADGVQLAETGLSVKQARSLSENQLLIGKSVHSVGAAIESYNQGADLLIAGSMFDTASHPGIRANGPRIMAEITKNVGIPVLGIGGVDASNTRCVMETGASGIAVMRSILTDQNPCLATRALETEMRIAWERCHKEPSINQNN